MSISPVLLCCPESSMDLVYFTLNFSRLRPYYVITLLVPAMLLSVLMVLTFLLPTDCGERLGYSMTILLSYTVMMTITSQLIPTTSKETPHISKILLVLTNPLPFIPIILYKCGSVVHSLQQFSERLSLLIWSIDWMNLLAL